MEAVTEQQIRLEATKIAAQFASPYDDIGNLLVHAGWIYSFITEGKNPVLHEVSNQSLQGNLTGKP